MPNASYTHRYQTFEKTTFMKKTFLVLFILLITISCKKENKESKKDNFELTVIANNFPDSTRVYLYNRNIGKNIDSTFVINENFKFSGKVVLPSLCYLEFYDKKNTHIAPYKYFFLENENISIVGEYSNFINAKVTGSKQTDLYTKYDSITAISKNKSFDEISFLFSNANNQMALTELLFKKKEVLKDSLLLFYKKLDATNLNSAKGRELLTYAKTIDIKIGDRFRDIIGKDLNGEQHKLSDYSGKIILLDFWASGCYPCRLQNKKEFPKLVKKYKKNDFIIVSYSLDTSKKTWRKSSEEDKINWLSISDLKGMKGENVNKYAVTAIPNSFLIDQNGIVVKSFIGFSEGANIIENQIDQLLK
jgi:thiol-disulfide isomerase/thioredoxin